MIEEGNSLFLKHKRRGIMDSFSRLPDELLLRIISSLPLKDAVRTSILSPRWRYLYASMYNLVVTFGDNSSDEVIPVNVMDIVNRFFFFRYGRCPIDLFYLCSSVLKNLEPLHIQGWIQAALWHGIRHLDLTISAAVRLPSSLCTCKTLEVLKVDVRNISGDDAEFDPNLEIPANVFLPSLKVLHLEDVIFSDRDSLNRLIANCPVLEEFDCGLYTGDCTLNISNPELKSVAIYYTDPESWSRRFKVLINAPNVVYLGYFVLGVASQTFENLKSLSSVTIDFPYKVGGRRHYINAVTDLMRVSGNVHTLRITGDTLIDIQKNSIQMPKFHCLTHLTVFCCQFSLGALLHFLERCVSLETLVFEDELMCSWNPLQEIRVSCLSSCLKTIEISSFDGKESQMEMVKVFLNCAKCLERMKVDFDNRCEDNKYEISKKLQMFPRASTKCVVVLD